MRFRFTASYVVDVAQACGVSSHWADKPRPEKSATFVLPPPLGHFEIEAERPKSSAEVQQSKREQNQNQGFHF